MSVRKWYQSEALASVRRLTQVLPDLTEEEVHACLDLEAASQRRQSVTDILIKRAVRLYSNRLQEKHHGKST